MATMNQDMYGATGKVGNKTYYQSAARTRAAGGSAATVSSCTTRQASALTFAVSLLLSRIVMLRLHSTLSRSITSTTQAVAATTVRPLTTHLPKVATLALVVTLAVILRRAQEPALVVRLPAAALPTRTAVTEENKGI